MSTSLVPNLLFGPTHSSLPLPGQLLLITDHLASPADFILHRVLASLSKTKLHTTPVQRIVLVSLAREFAQWRAIASKSNMNLTQHMNNGSLVFVDGLSLSAYQPFNSGSLKNGENGYLRCPPLFKKDEHDVKSLKGLYDIIKDTLSNPDADGTSLNHQVVILDEITVLELIGVPNSVLTRFVRALRALCRRFSAALIIRAHASPSSPDIESISFDTELLRALVDACHVHIEVRPLTSGRSGAVSGQITVHPGGLTTSVHENLGIQTCVQYRLNDGGAVFFEKGMAAGVL